ncbi:MAG: tail fiber protein [Pseudomonadota bacterium]
MRRILAAGMACIGLLPATAPAQDLLVGQIIIMGSNYCPRNTLPADGQLLSIQQNTALFSLFGTHYGGDGRTTFALPDLRGRFAMHSGSGPGLTQRKTGDSGGNETVVHAECAVDGDGAAPDIERAAYAEAPAPGPDIEVINPFQVVTYCVVTEGAFPVRQ